MRVTCKCSGSGSLTHCLAGGFRHYFGRQRDPSTLTSARRDLQHPEKQRQEGISAGDESGEVKRSQWGQALNDALRSDSTGEGTPHIPPTPHPPPLLRLHPTTNPIVCGQ